MLKFSLSFLTSQKLKAAVRLQVIGERWEMEIKKTQISITPDEGEAGGTPNRKILIPITVNVG